MPATSVSEIQPFKYGSDWSRKSAKSKNTNVPWDFIHCTIWLKFGTMVENYCGHKISKICSSEISVTRLNIFWNFELWPTYPKWRPKLLPVPILTWDSYSAPSTWSKTNIISRGSLGHFLRYSRPKFKNLKKFQTSYKLQNVAIFWYSVAVVVLYRCAKL